MNNFEAKYIHIASNYLSEKLNKLNTKQKKSLEDIKPKESKLQKLILNIFK